MKHSDLRVFLSVADTLSFSRSSEILHLSVSAVSRSIKRLEEELGEVLLERDRRQVSLTVAGFEFQSYARSTLAEWQQFRSRLGSDRPLSGEISLFCSVTASHSVLAPILEAFRQQQPGVEIMLHTGDQADGVARILSQQDDIAVSLLPPRVPGRMATLPLLQTPMVFIAPVAQCAVRDSLPAPSGCSAVVPGDFATVPFIIPERGVTHEMLQSWLAEHDLRPRIYAQVAGHEAILAMVALGLGVGVVPRVVLENNALASRVEVLSVTEVLPELNIGLCALRQRLAEPPLRALWDVASSTYGVDDS